MSVYYMVDAMKTKIGNPVRKLVLIKLADNANDDGICWPSYRHIADHCEVDRSTVIRHMKWLEENKFLTKQWRKDEEKGNKSNVYKIDIAGGTAHLVAQNNQGGCTEQPDPSGTVQPRTCHSSEPVIESVNSFAPSTDGACKECGGTGIEIGFDSASGGPIQYACSHCTGKEPQPTQTGYNRNSDEALGKNIEVYSQPPAKPEKPKKHKYQPEHMQFAEQMYQRLLQRNPNHKKPNLEAWANTIRLTVESDNRLITDLWAVFDWANRDDFWSSNILSPDKLRKQFDALIHKINKNATANQSTWQTQSGWSAGCESEMHRGEK